MAEAERSDDLPLITMSGEDEANESVVPTSTAKTASPEERRTSPRTKKAPPATQKDNTKDSTTESEESGDVKPEAKKKSPQTKAGSPSSTGKNAKRKSEIIDQPTTTEGPKNSEVAGVYAPLLRLQNKRELDEIPVVPLPSRTIGGLRDQIEKTKQCNCKRSHCLKLYCECFASGIHCSAVCNCVSCRNNESSGSDERNESILMTLERNAHAFRPRIIAIAGAAASVTGSAGGGLRAVHGDASPPVSDVLASPGGAHSMSGCNCKKSFCLKKYCECFHAAVYCNPPHCRCTDCQNKEGNPERERLVAKRRSQAEAAAAAAALAHQHSRLAHMSGRIMGDAGRTYYGTESGNASEKQDNVEASTAAAAMAAGAAAGGVDVFLPPSSYAVPMQLQNGKSYAALSFGTAGPRSMGQSAADASSAKYTSPARGTPRRKRTRVAPAIHPPSLKRETELETAWRQEVEKVASTFHAVRREIQLRPNFPAHGGGTGHAAAFGSPIQGSKASPDFQGLVATLEKSQSMVMVLETDLSKLIEVWKESGHLASEATDKIQEQNQEKAEGKSDDMEVEDPLQDKKSDSVIADGDVKLGTDYEQIDLEKNSPDNLTGGPKETEKYQNGDTIEVDSDKQTDEKDQAGVTSVINSASTGPRVTNKQPSVGVTDGHIDSESRLMCTEDMNGDEGQIALSDKAVRELTILAAQDAALLRELAQRVRQRALELTRERIRYIREVSGGS